MSQATDLLAPSPHTSVHFQTAWQLLPLSPNPKAYLGKHFAQLRTCHYYMPKVSAALTDWLLKLYI